MRTFVRHPIQRAAPPGEHAARATTLRNLNILDEGAQAELVEGAADDERCLRVVSASAIHHEACFDAPIGQARELIGPDFRPRAVEFSHHPPWSLAAYRRFFGAPVRFGAPETRLVLARASIAAGGPAPAVALPR